MRRIKFYSFASALMLASAMGFSSCSSDSPETGGNPGVAGETVKTLFAINVPYGKDNSSAKPQTRMGANETQAAGNFTGLEKMRLLTLTSEPGTNATTYTSNINIGDGDNAYAKDTWRSLYREVQIPVGTANFVLYGRAVKTDDYAKYGDIRINADAFNNDAAGNLSDIYFKLRTINDNVDFSTNTNSTAILNVLNNLVSAEAEYNPTQQGTASTEVKTVKWSEVTKDSPSDYRSESEREILANKYKQLISMKAGSANSVESLLQGFIDYFSEENIATGSSLTAEIINRCQDGLSKLIRNVFPRDINLPDGIAKLTFSESSKKFAYITAENTAIGDGNKIDYTKITYPACLGYVISSPAMISEKELTSTNGLPTYDSWVKNPETAWSNTDFTQAAVKSSTKTVALKNALQYGVANMKLSIRATEQTLKDNLHAIDASRQDQEVTVSSGGFTVTGVLVGGQPDQVEWDYEPKAETGFNQTIYDTKMNTTTEDGEFKAKYSAGTPSEYNYTLVFDNKNKKSGTKQDDVYVTVELENNAADFYGVDGLVPKGGKFYLVGKLSVDDATEASKKEGIDHIFVKDHTTTVNLAFKDLKNAYNCIPDLRTSKISLGLAVDLDWQAGLTFDVEIGK